MLIGRRAECERIEALIAAATEGGSGALLLHGEAGIGKTALLQHARDRAEERGMRVLTARGIETESDLAYTGLSDLLNPLLTPPQIASAAEAAAHEASAGTEVSGRASEAMDVLRARLPSAQATALGQALALGPEGTPARFAVPAAVLGLLSVAAEDAPVLCLVDDVQWIDAPSVEAMVFAARRLGDDGVAILFTERDREGRKVDPSGFDALKIEPLAPAAAGDLLRSVHGERLAGTVAAELVGGAGGNPLALVELSKALDRDQLAGRDPLPPVMPEGLSIERAFERELAELPEETRRALAVTAAADAGEDAAILGRALALAGVPPWVLDAAESADVIQVHGTRVDFRHPLLRAAAYHAATPAERRAAHRALADAHAEGAPQRAWHLAAAADGADENAAAVLDQAAADARTRGGFASAARAATRAAALSGDAAERARRLLDAARDFVAAGDPEQAGARAEAAYVEATDPLMRADLEWLMGHVWTRTGRPEDGERLLTEGAERVRAADPMRAAVMLLEATVSRLAVGGVDAAIAAARRAREAGDGQPATQALADILIGQALVGGGRVEEGGGLIDATCDFLASLDPVWTPSDVLALGANALLWIDRHRDAGRVLDRVIDAGRQNGALARLAYPLGVRCALDFRRGRWADAVAHGEEAVRAGRDTGQAATTIILLALLAEVEAHRGQTEHARGLGREALAAAERTRSFGFLVFVHHALGAAALAAGDTEEAIRELETAARWAEGFGTVGAGWVGWEPLLVEAYVAAERVGDARKRLAALERHNPGEQAPSVRAQIERCRGLVTGEDEHFTRALEHLDEADAPFERGRTHLALGERLRRRREPVESRRHLRAALDVFERLGAAPWAVRAREELRAGGVASQREEMAVVDVLTPHELQVALVVARGATNKEAAAQLFLSPKTVEHHLGSIYRKLDVRSRTDLARLLSARREPEEAAA
ncbi:MAG TPA: LuxR family transcriptional regulator [Solirubrobacteraceae bacterium]